MLSWKLNIKGACQNSALWYVPHWLKSKEASVAEATQISNHVVVISCHGLVGASSSNAEAVKNTKIRFRS